MELFLMNLIRLMMQVIQRTMYSESESGHVVEYDDTDGKTRFHQYASSGTFTEVDAVGNRTDKVQNNNYRITRCKFI